MSNTMNRIASDLQKIMSESDKKKTSGFDTQATVTRLDGDIAWVQFPGGEDETPVRRTTNAVVGDNVQVRVNGGRAWLLGNTTNPPTDDTVANVAMDNAKDANQNAAAAGAAAAQAMESAATANENARIASVAAAQAQTDAGIAHTAANEAKADAAAANTAATQAKADAAAASTAAGEAKTAANEAKADAQAANTAATEAKADAERANTAANDSLSQLSIVEDVVGTLNWITTHATYKASADTEVHAGKWYFTKSGDAYNVVTNPTGNPSAKGYYEVDTIDEAVSNYVASHLALTNEGLYLTKDGNGYKILLANDGLKVYDPEGHLVSTFGESIILDSSRPQTIGNNNVYIKYYDKNNDGTPDSLAIKADEFLLSSGKTIQEELEGVENWFYSVAPTTSNPPASSWTTDKLKEQHLRDIYFDTTSGKSYRWAKEGTTYKWVEIEDVELAALAKDLHDNYPPRSEFTVAPDKIQSTVSAAQTAATNAANTATDNKLKSYYTKAQTDSEITQTANSITSTVSSTYETKTDASSKLNTAKTYAEGKASTAEENAKADTIEKLKSYYTKTQTDSEISQKANEIALSVAQTEISKIEVGGRNLSLGSYNLKGFNSESSSRVLVTYSDEDVTIENTQGGTYGIYQDVAAEPSTNYTVSFVCTNISGTVRYSLGGWKADGTVIGSTAWNGLINYKAITEGKTSFSFTTPDDCAKIRIYLSVVNANSTAKFKRFKLEKGNKVTDWTPAPEDLEAYTDTQVSAAKAEIKVTTDNISSEVSKKVGNSEIISKINQSAETVKIQASKVEIDGTATFNAIKAKTDAAYDAKGAASAAKSEAISTAKAAIPTKVSQLNNDSGYQNASQVTAAVNKTYENYRYKYKHDIIVYGDSDKYYPIYINNDMSDYNQYVPHEFLIYRSYGEQAPSDWNTSTHKGGLVALIKWNYGGWGGATYRSEILAFSEQYSKMLGDILVGNKNGMNSTVYLRGGGSTGALYHLFSDAKIDSTRYGTQFPFIGTVDVGTIYMETGSYNWTVDAPLTTPNTAHINALMSTKEEQYIYISKASGTTSVSGTTTWVTETGDKQNTWTTKRPTYNSSYPVLFVAKQKKAVNEDVYCTTPVKDDTTTIIDGGHITTGTIDSNRLNADTIKVNAANIQGSLTIGQLPSTVAETDDIPTKVSELTNDSKFQTDTQVSTAVANEANARKATYATSSTAAGTQAKVAACSNFALYTGATITVGFTNANTHATPTLNVNSTGAKTIKNYTGAALTAAEYKWAAGAALTFVYDGSYWRMQDSGATESKAAAAASASTASTKASEAATSASTASTKASEAATSASTASTKASEASTSASTASSKATAAANSASTASTKASEASTSASTASSKATAAANSATAAENAKNVALDTVTVKDTRNDNQPPSWYISNYPKKRVQEFKSTSKIGLSGDTYCWLQTDVPWADSSGGYPKQMVELNGKQYWRQGMSTSAWSAWVDAYGTAVESAKTATNFISADSNGIMVYDGSEGTQAPSSPSSTTKNVYIDSDSVDIRTGTNVKASFGALTTIGDTSAAHAEITGDSFSIYDSTPSECFSIKSSDSEVLVDHDVYFSSPRSVTTLEPKSSTVTGTISTSVVPYNDSNTTYLFIRTKYNAKYNSTFDYKLHIQDTTTTYPITFTYRDDSNNIVYKGNFEIKFYKSNGNLTFTFKSNYSGFTRDQRIYIYVSGYREKVTAPAPTMLFGSLSDNNLGGYSVALGANVAASGDYSHAEGEGTTASGFKSHAEGSATTASGNYSHAEGYHTTASGDYSHAEGNYTTASKNYSSAGGTSSAASGICSHAVGWHVITNHDYQTAIGKFNDNDSNNAFEIGGGSSISNLANIFEVDWDGNVNIPSSAQYKINNKSIIDILHPVGSCYITSTNTDPSSAFGGTWELIDKRFSPTSNTTGETWNTTNTQGTCNFDWVRSDHDIWLRISWANKVAFSDSELKIVTINMATLGFVSGTAGYYQWFTGACDGINAALLMNLSWSGSTATIAVQDAVTRATSYPTTTGQNCYATVHIRCNLGHMADSACNQFVWKRKS